eukprot:SAG11_NODE_912_length_6580_cov_2.243018_5_plen_132_part_00
MKTNGGEQTQTARANLQVTTVALPSVTAAQYLRLKADDTTAMEIVFLRPLRGEPGCFLFPCLTNSSWPPWNLRSSLSESYVGGSPLEPAAHAGCAGSSAVFQLADNDNESLCLPLGGSASLLHAVEPLDGE